MKVEVKSKKGLRTILSVIVDKKNIQTKMDERLKELQKEVALKGFRPGKVPPEVIKISAGSALIIDAICFRALLTALRVNLPCLCIDDGFPYCSLRYGNIEFNTSS